MQKNLTLIIFVSLFAIVGCSTGQNNTGQLFAESKTNFPVKPLIILGDEDEGAGADIRLSIVSILEKDSSTVYKAVSSYKNKTLGLLVFIPKSKEDNNGFGKGIMLKSLGKESDILLNTLAEIYKLHIDSNAKFIHSIKIGYVNLGEFAKSIQGTSANEGSNTSEYKLFFEAKNDYAELYLNINPENKWLDLREKDSEYRPSIIKMLRN